MSRLRVAYVAHSVDPDGGGMELVSARLIERIIQEVDLEVVAGDGLDTVPAGVRTTRISIPRRPSVARLVVFDALATARLRAVRRRVDLVHSCGAVAHARVDLMTVHLSHAAVIDAQGGATPPGRRGVGGAVAAWRRRRAAGLERWAVRDGRTRELAAVSRADARDLATRYPTVPLTVIENGVDAARFGSIPSRRSADGPLSVVLVGGDFSRKGVPLAVRAIAGTARCRLRIVGEGEAAPVRALAHELGVADRVEVLGRVVDVAVEYAAADVVLSCSAVESFGLAMAEGAAAGCAVVCTPTGVGPELVASDDGLAAGGIVVEADAAAISAALDGLDQDRAGCQAMGVVAQRRAQRYSWDEMARLTLARYQALATRTP